MRLLVSRLGRALAVAGLLCGLATTPALADDHHDRHGDRHHWKHDDHHDRHGHWDHRSNYYGRDYDRHYYYSSGPRVGIYAPPVYIPPPPPPSFGLSLVFPIH